MEVFLAVRNPRLFPTCIALSSHLRFRPSSQPKCLACLVVRDFPPFPSQISLSLLRFPPHSPRVLGFLVSVLGNGAPSPSSSGLAPQAFIRAYPPPFPPRIGVTRRKRLVGLLGMSRGSPRAWLAWIRARQVPPSCSSLFTPPFGGFAPCGGCACSFGEESAECE